MLAQIEHLKKQRKAFMSALNQINDTGIHKQASKELLACSVEALLSHLEEEKNLFYPAVIEFLDDDGDIQTIINKFDAEITLIKDEAIRMANSAMANTNESEFHKDFKIFLLGLQLRFTREEQLIFSKIKKLYKLISQHIYFH